MLFHIGLLGMLDVLVNFYFASLGHGQETIGLLQSLPRLAGFLTSIPLGLLANRIGGRRVMILASVGCAVALWLQLFATLPMLGVSRFLFGLFYGAQQIANAPLMVELVESDHRTRFFAIHNLLSMVAMAFGSFIGGFLPSWIVGASGSFVPADWIASATTAYAYGAATFIAGIVGVVSVLPLLGMPEGGPARPAVDTSGVRIAINRKTIPWVLIAMLTLPMLTFGFSGGLTFPFYNLFWRTEFDLPDQTVGTILSIGWVGMALLPMIGTRLERAFGRALALLLALLAASLSFFVLGLLPALVISVAAFVLAISARNMMNPLYQPLLFDSLPTSLHNVASSMSMVMWNSGWFIATALGGFIAERFGFSVIMILVSVTVLVSGVMVVFIFRRRGDSLQQVQQQFLTP